MAEPRRPKAFRTQLLHRWLVETYDPCRVADVGGGKGLLAYLLRQSGWDATVIDPHDQPLPAKYTTLERQRVRIGATERIPRIARPFDVTMVQRFDLLVGMHAHGSNMAIIDGCAAAGNRFVLFPCCVIDEPIDVRPGVDWLASLVGYAESRGHEMSRVELPFAGQNVGIYNVARLR